MNDKQQLAAMGEHLSEQLPMCMAKRIEELEAQVRVMAELLRRGRPIIDERADFGLVAGRLLRDIDAALAGSHSRRPKPGPVHADLPADGGSG